MHRLARRGVEERVEQGHPGDAVDRQPVACRRATDRLGVGGVVDAERREPVVTDVGVDPCHAEVLVDPDDATADIDAGLANGSSNPQETNARRCTAAHWCHLVSAAGLRPRVEVRARAASGHRWRLPNLRRLPARSGRRYPAAVAAAAASVGVSRRACRGPRTRGGRRCVSRGTAGPRSRGSARPPRLAAAPPAREPSARRGSRGSSDGVRAGSWTHRRPESRGRRAAAAGLGSQSIEGRRGPPRRRRCCRIRGVPGRPRMGSRAPATRLRPRASGPSICSRQGSAAPEVSGAGRTPALSCHQPSSPMCHGCDFAWARSKAARASAAERSGSPSSHAASARAARTGPTRCNVAGRLGDVDRLIQRLPCVRVAPSCPEPTERKEGHDPPNGLAAGLAMTAVASSPARAHRPRYRFASADHASR